jgi:hypothetical protein
MIFDGLSGMTMFEGDLGLEVGSAGQTTGDVSEKQMMGFHLFDLPAVRLALVDITLGA